MMKRLWHFMRRLSRSLFVRMLASHIAVAVLTSAMVVLLIVGLTTWGITTLRPKDYRDWVFYSTMDWQFQLEGNEALMSGLVPLGFTIIADSEGQVLYAQGDSPCKVGMILRQCAPTYADSPEYERFVQTDERDWVENVLLTVDGERVINRRATYTTEDIFSALIPGVPVFVSGVVFYTALTMLIMAVLSLPAALVVVWMTARPLARRLTAITQVSQRFGSGDLTARVQEQRQDEVGLLAQQVNHMAEALQQNMQILRELAQHNALLTQQAEQSAIQAERLRISRDLHDAIAQRLFSLTVSTATLPDLIQQDQARGVQQAQSVANLAEQTLLDLRTLLLELRPTAMLQQTLAEAIRQLCHDWQQTHQAIIDVSLLLTGRYLPAGVENAIYYSVQESLSNIGKHAEASLVSVSLLEKPHQLILSVTDNGRGFADAQPRPGQFGLLSMRERANALGGEMHIESDTARGCTIRLLLPVVSP